MITARSLLRASRLRNGPDITFRLNPSHHSAPPAHSLASSFKIWLMDSLRCNAGRTLFSSIGVSRSSSGEANKGFSMQLEKFLALPFLPPDICQLQTFSWMFLKVLNRALSANLPSSFRGNLQKKTSIFVDIVHVGGREVNPMSKNHNTVA